VNSTQTSATQRSIMNVGQNRILVFFRVQFLHFKSCCIFLHFVKFQIRQVKSLFSAKILQINRVEVEKNSVTIQRNRFLAKAELRFYTTFPGFMSVAVFCHRPKQIYRNFLKQNVMKKKKR
jgi:hypothetical protein